MSRAEREALGKVPAVHRAVLATVISRLRLLHGMHQQPAEFRVLQIGTAAYECYAIGYRAPLTAEQMERVETVNPAVVGVWMDFTVQDGAGGLCASVRIGAAKRDPTDDDDDDDDARRAPPRRPSNEEDGAARSWMSRLFG